MRRRIVTLTVLAAVLATTLFGLPLAIVAAETFGDDTVADLERAADAVAVVVSKPLANGQPVPPPVVGPGDDEAEARIKVGVYSPDGRRLAGHGPPVADEVTRRVAGTTKDMVNGSLGDEEVLAVPVLSGDRLTGVIRAALPRSELNHRIALAWLAMAGCAALAVTGSWLLARWIAARLTRPLEELAAAAGRLGDGDFTVRSPRPGIPEIDKVGSALDTTAERIGETLERERAFSADASHQLRTPLTGLRLQLEAALENPGQDPRSAIEAGLGSVDRLERTIEDLLALARQSRAPRAPLDLDTLLDELRQTWQPVLAGQGRELVVRAEDAPPARAAAAAIRQVLSVLVDNAVTHGSGTVTVVTRDAGDTLAIDVVDEGPDLGEADPFTLDHTQATGHGIGLRLARSLAEAEDGRLRLSKPDPPTFTLLLPAATGTDPHD
ncbi:sensor histidine kinase [Amycolatopsis sp. NPDC059027]|uniref:sensor histidine kinase n=1 Tax=Amycolatopsis sp. NPDC059027 TaxID=3346709 RepID=UPI0036702AFB